MTLTFKSWLTNFSASRAVGLFIAERAVTISHVVGTPFGNLELTRRTAELGDQPLAAVLDRLLDETCGPAKPRRMPIVVGLPGESVFFSTRPIQATAKDPPPHVLLRETLQSPSITIDGQTVSIEEMEVDLLTAQPLRRRVASMVACPAGRLTALLATLKQCGVQPDRIEPAPCAMLRTAEYTAPAPRKAKVVVRVFLRDATGLAVLVANGMPMVWRSFELVKGNEGSSILSVFRSLELLGKYCGVDVAIGGLLLHGRADLGGLLEFDRLQKQLGVPSTWTDAPRLNDAEIAFGLALGGLVKDRPGFDLARRRKPKPSLWMTFPWRELAAMVLLLADMTGLLCARYITVQSDLLRLRVQNAERGTLAGVADETLRQEKEDLLVQVGAARRFLDGSVAWTTFLNDIAVQLPDRARLTMLEGVNESDWSDGETKARKRLKKLLTLKGEVKVAANGAMPKEIDQLLDRLRTDALLKQHLPLIELIDLRQVNSNVDLQPVAAFQLQCSAKQTAAKE